MTEFVKQLQNARKNRYKRNAVNLSFFEEYQVPLTFISKFRGLSYCSKAK